MSAYLYSIGATAAIFTLLALSLNIITGYAGQAMMGHAAFFGIGAYTAAILTQTYHVNFFLALLIAMLFTGACGALLGLISLRLQADFLAITTIGINFVMVALFNNMSITGGSLGLTILKPMHKNGQPPVLLADICRYCRCVFADHQDAPLMVRHGAGFHQQ